MFTHLDPEDLQDMKDIAELEAIFQVDIEELPALQDELEWAEEPPYYAWSSFAR